MNILWINILRIINGKNGILSYLYDNTSHVCVTKIWGAAILQAHFIWSSQNILWTSNMDSSDKKNIANDYFRSIHYKSHQRKQMYVNASIFGQVTHHSMLKYISQLEMQYENWVLKTYQCLAFTKNLNCIKTKTSCL